MFEFSKKYNIKINTTNNINNILSNFKEVKVLNEYNKLELYFINDSINIKEIKKFKSINDYAVIVKNGSKKEIKLYNEKIYTTLVTDILTASKIIELFGYTISFLVKRNIYEYNYKNTNFYIQYVNDKNYFLTFENSVDKEIAYLIIDLFKNKLNIDLDDKLYFDIIQDEFSHSK